MGKTLTLVDGRYKMVDTQTSSAGDIDETSFSGSNNQSSFSNITGLLFSNASVQSFNILLSVKVDATSNLYESFTLNGIQKDSSWNLSVSSVGDESGVEFQITTSGQIQYTSDNYTGFSSLSIKYRATTTSV